MKSLHWIFAIPTSPTPFLRSDHKIHHSPVIMAESSASDDLRDPFTELEHTNWQRGTDAYNEGFGPLTSQTIPTLLEGVNFPTSTEKEMSQEVSQKIRTLNYLDVACGPGQVLSAAISVAKAAEVNSRNGNATISYSALDFSSKFLEMAKQTLAQHHKDVNINFVEGDAQSMPFPDDTFTHITCNFGILHLLNPDAFLRESFRILQPNAEAKISFSTWASPPETEGFQLILNAVTNAGNPNVPLPEGPSFFRFSNEDEVRRSMESAGFVDVAFTTVCDMKWNNLRDAEHLYQIFLEGTARTRELLRGQTTEETKAIKEELDRKWKQRNTNVPLRMPAIVASGRKP